MTKELEAFEDLKRQVGNMPYTSYDNGLGNRTTFLIKDSAIFPLIENALKDYEKIKIEYRELRTYHYDLLKENERLHNQKIKKLKALEIIKKKKVNVRFLISCKTLKEYNDVISDHLTQDEYDLLKEVLL